MLLGWLVLAGWPVHVILAISVALTTIFAVLSDQPGILSAVLAVAAHYVLGLWASFAVHEGGHAVVLMHARGVTALTMERTVWRLSISAHGTILGRDAFLAALAGPGACAVVGVALWALAPEILLHGWYLAHAIFLTPLFNDGRTLLSAARAWNRTLTAPHPRFESPE